MYVKCSNHPFAKHVPLRKILHLHPSTCISIFTVPLFVKAKNWKKTQMPINSWIHKQIVLDPYNEMLLSNKKKSTNNKHNNMEVFKNYSERGQRQVVISWFHLCEILEWSKCFYSSRKGISSCPGLRFGERWLGWLQISMGKVAGVMGMLYILIVK